MFLGDNLLVYLVLALGGALAVGNIAALVKPPAPRLNTKPSNDEGESAEESTDLEKAPVARSLVMAVIGATAAVWAIASLLK